MARRRRLAPRNARTTNEIETSSGNRHFPEPTKPTTGRTKSEAIKQFKAAKAITQRDPDVPKPRARKRRGDSDSRLMRLALDMKRREIRALHRRRGKSAARGRYQRLPTPRQQDKDEFSLAARALCNVAEGIANVFADFQEQLHRALYGRTGLDWVQFWDNNASHDQYLDDSSIPKQDQNFPQL